MKLQAFRIQSFRSIDDSKWNNFSRDNINVLVGQNESGKSSILEALHFIGRSNAVLKPADLRSDNSIPSVSLRAEMTRNDFDWIVEGRSKRYIDIATQAFSKESYNIQITTTFSKEGDEFEVKFDLDSPVVLPNLSQELREQLSAEDLSERATLESDHELTISDLASKIPFFSLFKENSATLPDSINLEGTPLFKGQIGQVGAKNFLSASGLDAKKLLSSDDRIRATLIRQANASINKELNKYWSQYLGEDKKISIEVEFGRHPPGHGEKPGVPYLSFWVSEGAERFYPSQRSRGTRWFVSVFLHLLATEKENKDYVVMLDEPGSFLHIKAQSDVSSLIGRISEHCPVIYSTHSPELVDFTRPYQIFAVERSGAGDLADTEIFHAMSISAASVETLSPILAKMGADMRHQVVIKKFGNVVLEEPSAHYYLRAFEFMLFPSGSGLSYIPASGVNNIPTIFALLLAWGLDFIVLTDDDSQARGVRKDLIKNYFGDDATLADRKLIRLKDKSGVEDCFSPDEFCRVVLGGEFTQDLSKKNSVFAKEKKINKSIAAYRFFIKVESGEISAGDFSQETIEFFRSLIQEMVACSEKK